MSGFNWSDLVDAAGAGLQPIPDGEYELQVNKATVKPTSTGKVNIQVQFNVIAGPHTTRPVWNNFTLSPENPNALGYFFRNMNAMGLDANYFKSNPTPETVAEALVGKLVHAVVGHDTYKGEKRNIIGSFSPSQLAGQATPPAPAPIGAAAPVIAPPPVAAPMIAAPVIAPPPVAAPPVAVAPVAPPAPSRQFDPASGMEWNGAEWIWPPEHTAGQTWNGTSWNSTVAPPPAPVAPPAPPAPVIAPPIAPVPTAPF